MAGETEAKGDAHGGTGHIIQSLVVNLAIAAVKAVAAYFTKSGSMLAEALHSFSDCGNQLLLLVGVRQARKPADERHPFGYGRAVYFWSFMVALMLFLGGGVFSIYEGVHKIREPEPVERVWLGVGILAVSLLLEGGATLSNVRELNRRRGAKGFYRYLKDTTDSDLVVVFGENSAAVLGLVFAIAALALAAVTGDGRWDGVGSSAIGLVLVGVAAFLAIEVSSLLLGEAAAPEIADAARETAKKFPELERVLNVVTMQQGPGEVLVHVKLAFAPSLTVEEACRIINEYEAAFRAARSEVRWVFVEPDIPRAVAALRPAAKAPAADEARAAEA
ncbi:MAG: cation diffusion facilitator family transporter [Labilithrix sp.]|nr:cation diffusion facilitator family transporter [Labilithrix sp.]MCW5834676.1 cation diffusion facilitator family transporter [Labilithrix sp.]